MNNINNNTTEMKQSKKRSVEEELAKPTKKVSTMNENRIQPVEPINENEESENEENEENEQNEQIRSIAVTVIPMYLLDPVFVQDEYTTIPTITLITKEGKRMRVKKPWLALHAPHMENLQMPVHLNFTTDELKRAFMCEEKIGKNQLAYIDLNLIKNMEFLGKIIDICCYFKFTKVIELVDDIFSQTIKNCICVDLVLMVAKSLENSDSSRSLYLPKMHAGLVDYLKKNPKKIYGFDVTKITTMLSKYIIKQVSNWNCCIEYLDMWTNHCSPTDTEIVNHYFANMLFCNVPEILVDRVIAIANKLQQAPDMQKIIFKGLANAYAKHLNHICASSQK